MKKPVSLHGINKHYSAFLRDKPTLSQCFVSFLSKSDVPWMISKPDRGVCVCDTLMTTLLAVPHSTRVLCINYCDSKISNTIGGVMVYKENRA